MKETKDLTLDRSYQVDWLLVGLIREVEKRELDEKIPDDRKHINVILTIGGMLVGGELVSHNHWIEDMRGEIASEGNDDLHEMSEAASAETDPASEKNEDERRFIHLRNAKFYQGGTVVPGEGEGFLWRGKVASVDGFNEGALIMSKTSPRVEVKGVRIRTADVG